LTEAPPEDPHDAAGGEDDRELKEEFQDEVEGS
jgi:hypothetical protein